MRERLTIPRAVLEALRCHARDEAPREACGLLGGDRDSGTAHTFRAARNVADSAYLYRMDPGEVVTLVEAIAADGDALLAIVHSHPASRAVPSPTDLREAAWPDVWHLLVSLDERVPEAERIRAWRLRGGRADEIGLELA